MIRTDLKLLKDMKNKGLSSESQLLDLAIQIIEDEVSMQIRETNHQISDGINFLRDYKEWSNLSKIAKHAIEECFHILKEKENNFEYTKLINIIRFKKDISRMGKNEFWELLSDKAKEKYFGKD